MPPKIKTMKLLVLAGLCALAMAKLPSSSWEQEHIPQWNIQEDAFRAGKEYKFKYDGQLATGIPQSSRQHSSTRIQALVSLVFKDQDTCVMEIEKIRVGQLNRRIPNPRAMIPFQAYEQVEINSKMEQRLKLPLKFTYNKGMISEVVFDGKEEPWSANIKRGILNMLQVNLQKNNQVDLTEEARITNRVPRTQTPDLDFFSVMESTLEGQCETYYTVTSQPSPRYSSGQVLNVTKSIDFEKCQKRPDIKYNWRFEDPCPTCQPKYSEHQKFLKASTIAKYNISGTKDQFLIESAIVESQYNFVPFNRKGNMMTTYVNQTLVLMTAGRPQGQTRSPKNPQQSDSDMVYSPEWDIQKEALFMEGEDEFLKETPYSELKNKVNFVKEILRRLISEMSESVQEEAPRQYLRLVKIFRMLKLSQIQEIHRTFYKDAESFTPEQHMKIKEILVDALADAATKDTIQHLVQKIKSKEIKPLRAAISIKQLINCRVVSQEMIEQLQSLADSQVCQRNFFLRQSVYLTMGSMVNALCQPNKDKLAKEFKVRPNHFCPREFQQQLVQRMFEKFENAQDKADKLIYIKCIANMGLDLSVFELEKIIKNVQKRESPIMRTEAIVALRQIKHTMPRKVQSICMPVFMDRKQPTEVRIACAYTLLQTLPSRPVLDQVSRKLFSERNQQVASFVYTYMMSMANSTNPCFQKMAKDLQLSLRHGKRISQAFTSPRLSKFIHSGLYSKQARMGVHMNTGSVFSKRSPIPRWLGVDFNANQLGQWNNHIFSLGVVSTNMDSLLQKYLGSRGLWTEMDLEDILIRSPRSSSTSSPKVQLQKIWQKLKTVARSLPQNPEGFITLRFKDQEFGFLPFSAQAIGESLSEVISEGKVNLREIEQMLESGYQFHLYKAALIHEMSYKIPTTLGMPLVLSVKVPTVIQLTGQVKAKITNQWKKSEIELVNTKPSMVTSVVLDIQCWSPMVNSGLKVVGLSKVYTPVDGSLQLDLTKSPAQLVAKYNPIKKPVQWLHLETRPMTYIRVWPKFLKTWQEPQEKTIRGEEWTRQYNFERDFPIVKKFEEFCEKSLGFKLNLKGQWHHTPVMRHSNTPFCPLSGPNKLYLRTSPTEEQPRTVVVKMTSSLFKSQSSPLRFSSEVERILRSASEGSEEEMESEWRQVHSQSHHQSTFKAELSTKGGKSIQAEFEAKVQCDPSLRICKIKSQIERSSVPQYDSRPFKMCMESEYLLPRNPQSFSQLRGKKVVGSIKTTWGQQCNSENFVDVKIVAQRSRQQRQRLQEEPEFIRFSEENCRDQPERCSPISQYRSLRRAARVNQLEVEAEWQNVSPYVKNVTSKLYRALKTALYWNSQVNNVEVQNPSNQIKVRLTLDPRSKQHLNMTVKTPKEKTIFRDLPLPIPIKSYSLKRSSEKMSSWSHLFESMSQQVSPVCQVSSHQIQTFDQVQYQVPISTCWSVLAKDCQSQNFAVLMKKISSGSSQKKVKIVSPFHQITLEPQQSSQQIKVTVNGEQIQVEQDEPTILRNHGHQVCRIQKSQQQQSVKVSLPEQGVRVYFDGYTAAIKMSPQYQNLQCGLCGHYDNDQDDEFRNPQSELESDVRSFYQKFTMQEESCQFPEELSEICQEPSCQPQSRYEQQSRWYQSSSESQESSEEEEQSSPRSWEQRQQYRPVQRTKVIEQNGKICFSKTRVPRCPHHTYPSQHEKARKVVYACLPRDDPEVDSILAKLSQQRSRSQQQSQTPSRIQSLPSAFNEVEPQPQRCQRMA